MKKLLITTALVAFTAAPLVAQTAETTTDPAAASDMMATPMYMSGDMEVSADKIIGMNVYIQKADMAADPAMDPAVGVADASDNWDDVGEVGDVLVSADGTVNSVVIDAGGFLGMGERHVNVTMDQLQFVPDTDDEGEFFVVYTGDKSMLEGSDEYDQTAMESQGYMPYTPMNTDGAMTNGATATTSADPMMRPVRDGMESIDTAALTSEELTGARVYGISDEWVGEIGQLVLADDGKITEAVIDVGGWLGMGEHPVALSFDKIDVRRDGDNVVVYVDYTEEELKALPKWNG